MKKIAIISDTHNNQILLRKSLENEKELDYIFHLGDYYDDLKDNLDLMNNRIVLQVPGIYNPKYLDGILDKTKEVVLDNWKFILVHDINDSKQYQRNNDIILFGHTHHPTYEISKGKLFLNPGHLKSDKDRGSKASYCLAEISKNNFLFSFKSPLGEIIKQHNLNRDELEDK